VVVISVDQLSSGPSELAIVVPFTTNPSDNPIRVRVEPPEGGVREESWAMPEMVRAVDRARLVERWGQLRAETLDQVAARVRLLVRTGA
jgi:mRNA interferase MazF